MSIVAIYMVGGDKKEDILSTQKRNIHCQKGPNNLKGQVQLNLAYVFFCVCVCQLFGWAHLEDSMNNCHLGAGCC